MNSIKVTAHADVTLKSYILQGHVITGEDGWVMMDAGQEYECYLIHGEDHFVEFPYTQDSIAVSNGELMTNLKLGKVSIK